MGACRPSVCPAPAFWSRDSQTGDGNRRASSFAVSCEFRIGIGWGLLFKTLSLNWHGEDLEHVWRHGQSGSSERKCIDGQKQRGKSGEHLPDC